MAALLNAGNNALNQIYDLEIDRVNKPKRPLPSGRLTIAEVWWFTNITYALALVLAWLVAPKGRHECFWLVAVAVVCTYLYSVPPFRTKRLGIWANVTIAIPRGVLLKVAGWSSVKTIVGLEPWYIGAIFGLLTAIGGEMVSASDQGGLGHQLIYFSSLIRMENFGAVLLIIEVLGLSIYFVFYFIGKRWASWES